MNTAKVGAASAADSNDMLGYRDAAALLGVPLGTLYSWVSKRCVPHIRLGPKLVRFSRDDLAQWIQSRRVSPLRDADGAL